MTGRPWSKFRGLEVFQQRKLQLYRKSVILSHFEASLHVNVWLQTAGQMALLPMMGELLGCKIGASGG